MSRTIDAATVTALAADSFRLANLLQMDFTIPSPQNIVRLTDWGHDLTALSATWDSSPHFMGVTTATESGELRVSSVTVRLSGVEQTFVSLFLNNQYHDVRLRQYKAVLDSSAAVVGAPILVFDGRISDFGMGDSESDVVIEVVAASHWANFDAIAGRRTNHNSQQLFFSGDLGFEFAADTVEEIKWGRG